MNRSPLCYPLSRGMDADAGGFADLQTDVMRFMAILSLCLVAIFALVQSIPLAPSAEEPAPAVQAAKRQIVATPVEQATPHPEPIATVAEAIVAKPPAPDPPQEGFTLRFDNDVALTRLVARNEVGLYAIYPDRSFRLNVNRGQMSAQ